MLNLDAFLQTALLITVTGSDALAFVVVMRDVTVEDAVQVAMLADAADEAPPAGR